MDQAEGIAHGSRPRREVCGPPSPSSRFASAPETVGDSGRSLKLRPFMIATRGKSPCVEISTPLAAQGYARLPFDMGLLLHH